MTGAGAGTWPPTAPPGRGGRRDRGARRRGPGHRDEIEVLARKRRGPPRGPIRARGSGGAGRVADGPPPENSLAEWRRTMQSAGAGRNRAGRLRIARPGSAAGRPAAIERLLREQNELIRQDLQRNASPHRSRLPRRCEVAASACDPRRSGPRTNETDMNPNFGGSSIFGTACHVVHSPHPVALQKDGYFGVTGMTSLYGGGRGRTFEVTGVLVGTDLANRDRRRRDPARLRRWDRADLHGHPGAGLAQRDLRGRIPAFTGRAEAHGFRLVSAVPLRPPRPDMNGRR